MRLLYDASGSHLARDAYFDELRAKGVQVRPYGWGAFLGHFRPGIRARHEYARWLAHDLRIFEFQKVVMHSKYAVVDDDFCAIGSCYNANVVAARFTLEIFLVVRPWTRFVDATADVAMDAVGLLFNRRPG